MKVLALNGSPRKRASATFRILDTLLAGMRDAGAATELVHLQDLDLRPCLGCYTCWVATPGACVHGDRDGMAGMIAAWRDADLVVLGTPLYHFSMSGLMKTFIDRLLPELEPWLVPDPDGPPGRTRHPRRHTRRSSAAMLVSPCGFPDVDQFASLVHWFRYFVERSGWRSAGEILRPGAEALSRAALAPLFAPYLDAVRRAGAAVVEQGRIPDALAAELAKDLFPGGRAAFLEQANRFWEGELARRRRPAGRAGAAPEEGAASPADGPGLTCKNLVAGMATTFDPAVAGDLDARIEFRMDGAEPGTYHLAVAGGACRFEEGPARAPALTIEAPSDVWTEIASGRRDGRQALMDGAYRAKGDLALLLRMGRLFRRAP